MKLIRRCINCERIVWRQLINWKRAVYFCDDCCLTRRYKGKNNGC